MVCFPPALLFSATLPCAENRHLVSLEQNVGVVAQLPALWQTHPVPRPGGGSVSRGLTVKLRTSCLLCHLCADISEYLTMLLPPPLLCHTPTPTGLEILPGFHLFSTPNPSHWGHCPGLFGMLLSLPGRQHGKPLEKHDPMQMSKAWRAFPP